MRSIPATRQVVCERGAQLLVTFGPDRFRAWGREAPGLALSEEAVGWGPDRHACGVQVPASPDVVATGVDAHGQVEGKDLTSLRQPLRQLRHLLVRDPLGVDVIALVDEGRRRSIRAGRHEVARASCAS